ncbi:MAG: anhydro-N-acetylmuramic acid kinase, partial [Pseudomonadota bacterium]|nr:anhydro-N-acetylmuramic acid kinase [Pseudomonadota bacterium]
MSQPRWFAGLMTGTVLDGEIDVALIRTDGHDITEFGPSGMVPYPDRLRQRLAECVEAAAAWDFHGPEPAIFGELETETTVVQSDAVIEFVRASGVDMTNIAAIGFHGQTILHRAPTMHKTGNTRQLGDGTLMAARTGRQVVYDFRSADMAEGGQGAPLCPVYHAALLNRHGFGPEAAILNLGGIGNITWRSSAGEL